MHSWQVEIVEKLLLHLIKRWKITREGRHE